MSTIRKVFLSKGLPLTITSIVVFSFLVGMVLFQSVKSPPASNEQTVAPTPTAKKLTTTAVYSGLTGPTAITAAHSSDRLYIAEQSGIIRIAENGQLAKKPFIDIRENVQAKGEMGLLGIAFHPNLANDRRVFLNYVDNNQVTNISSFTVANNFLSADPQSEKVLLQLQQPYANHNGGELQFGPDGFLYIATGDGGSGGDPQDRAQDLSNLFGKILRVDIDNGDPYKIPSDNPFVKTAGAKGEIWHYGLRNPWRFSFDKKTGAMWIADVGQNKWEEVSYASNNKSGLNFGWRCYEARHQYNLEGCGAASGYTKPVVEYDHSAGRCSVTGGYVYRGTKHPSLEGYYIYADFCGGQLYVGTLSGTNWKTGLSLETDFRPTTFGQDNNGELYIADSASGTIYQLGAQ